MLLQISMLKYRYKIERIVPEYRETRRPKLKLSRVYDVTFRKTKTNLEVYNSIELHYKQSSANNFKTNFKLYFIVMIIGVDCQPNVLK